jgi:hypothetical protein
MRIKSSGFDLDSHIKVAHVANGADVARAKEQYRFALNVLAAASDEEFESLFGKAHYAERRLKALGAL